MADGSGLNAVSKPSWLIDLDQRPKDTERMVKLLTMEASTMQTRNRRAVLATAVLACGTMGSIEWPSDTDPPQHFLRGDFTISVSAAAAEAHGPIRRASCALVRYYVARYTAATAEAWTRSKGATDAEIQTARSCIKPQLTALAGHVAD
jgi:hypothetical protein